MTFQYPIGQMLQIADATGSDDWHSDGVADRTVQSQIEAALGAVPVHTGQQNLARAIVHHANRPLHGIDTGRLAPAVSEDLPPVSLALCTDLLGIHRHHDALRTEPLGGLAH